MLACTNMKRRTPPLGLVLAALMALAIGQRWLPAGRSPPFHQSGQTAAADLTQFPADERQAIDATLALLKAGGPSPYGKDGSEFTNREAPPPAAERGLLSRIYGGDRGLAGFAAPAAS